jgi:hypothetical protein
MVRIARVAVAKPVDYITKPQRVDCDSAH